jgi:hypothetical protein
MSLKDLSVECLNQSIATRAPAPRQVTPREEWGSRNKSARETRREFKKDYSERAVVVRQVFGEYIRGCPMPLNRFGVPVV